MISMTDDEVDRLATKFRALPFEEVLKQLEEARSGRGDASTNIFLEVVKANVLAEQSKQRSLRAKHAWAHRKAKEAAR